MSDVEFVLWSAQLLIEQEWEIPEKEYILTAGDSISRQP